MSVFFVMFRIPKGGTGVGLCFEAQPASFSHSPVRFSLHQQLVGCSPHNAGIALAFRLKPLG